MASRHTQIHTHLSQPAPPAWVFQPPEAAFDTLPSHHSALFINISVVLCLILTCLLSGFGPNVLRHKRCYFFFEKSYVAIVFLLKVWHLCWIWLQDLHAMRGKSLNGFCLKLFFCKQTKGLLPAFILPRLPRTVRLTFSRPLPRSARGHEVRKRSQLDKCRPVFLTLSCLALCKPLPLILSLNISLFLHNF